MSADREASPGDPTAPGRPTWTVVASGSETDGGFELIRERRNRLGGPAPHVHRDREEGFYVLAGRYVFTRGTEELELGPGEFVLVPRGTRHTFRTLVRPSETLIVVAPAGLEAFFRAQAALIDAGATPLEAMTRLSAEHDAHPVD
jgi:mannose-6-phosphate isomerase-like protein (cupin superfamily)